MDIILLESIDNVGGIGDKVAVKPGYARNYLIPQGKATVATPENLGKFEAMRAELEAKAVGELEEVQNRAAKIEGQVIKIQANAGPEGKLFGSVGTIDIADACEVLGLAVKRSEVRLPDGPIRVAGEHQVELHLHANSSVFLTVIVEGALTEVPLNLLEDKDADEIGGVTDAQIEDSEEEKSVE
jgi:large subunit ribosomal protein L9